MAAVRRGTPLLPDVLRQPPAGRSRAPQTPSATGPASFHDLDEGSDSMEDTDTPRSPTSCVSWISDDVRGAQDTGTDGLQSIPTRASPAIARRPSALGIQEEEEAETTQRPLAKAVQRAAPPEASAAQERTSTAAGLNAGFREAPAPRYSSYRSMPSWEAMAEKASERMGAWVVPNGKCVSESEVLGRPAGTLPGTLTTFDRVKAAQAAQPRAVLRHGSPDAAASRGRQAARTSGSRSGSCEGWSFAERRSGGTLSSGQLKSHGQLKTHRQSELAPSFFRGCPKDASLSHLAVTVPPPPPRFVDPRKSIRR